MPFQFNMTELLKNPLQCIIEDIIMIELFAWFLDSFIFALLLHLSFEAKSKTTELNIYNKYYSILIKEF